jgi:hypothetical protein
MISAARWAASWARSVKRSKRIMDAFLGRRLPRTAHPLLPGL